MTKLFQINVVANSGSTGRIAEKIAQIAINHGWECYTAYGRWCTTSNTQLVKIGNKLSVVFHYCMSRIFDCQGLASYFATYSLIRQIDKIHPDIIHLHNVHGYYLNYPLLFNYLSAHNYPVVWTLHDCWAYTGHCPHYTSAKCTKWVSGCYDCPNLKKYPASFFDNSKANYRRKSYYFNKIKNLTIVSVSNWLSKEIHKSFLKKNRIVTISNGVDISMFRPIDSDVREKYGIGSCFLVIAVATWWTEGKGFGDFMQLANIVDKDVKLIMVGVSNNQMNSLPRNIIGIQRTENISELVQLYSAADLYVNFSIEESFGLTTAESLSCGTPVLVYDSTACPDIVTPKTGFVVPPHDLLEANRVIEHVKTVGKSFYSENCRQYALTHLDDTLCYEQYLSLYKKILHK